MPESSQQDGNSDARSPADLVEQGRTFHREGRLDEAERLYAQALAADEDCAEAHQLRAVIAGQQGRFDEAIAGFRRTIALEGPTPDRLYNLAEAHRVRGDFQPALDAYSQVLTLDASYLDAYRSSAAMVTDAADRARASGDTASADRLGQLAAHYLVGLGHACLRIRDVANAENAYRESVALDPGKAEAFNCLGVIALETMRLSEAETLCRRAVALDPRSALYLNNLGRALLSQVRVDEALPLFRQALEIDPSFADARTNLEERMLPWLHYRADLPPSAVFAAHRDWGRMAVERDGESVRSVGAFPNPRDPDRRLNVAYVALDTGARISHRFFAPLLANHDLKQIRTLVYSAGGTVDGERVFKAIAGQYRQIPLRRGQDIAKMLRRDGIDIVVDLAGHLPHNRLDIFVHKPAPIAVTWLGYPDTTGLPTIDYRITDEVADPPGAEQLHSERLYRLASGSLVYRPAQNGPELVAPPARAPGAVTFGSFDDPRKISPEVVGVWCSILRSLPQARLLLMAPEFVDTALAARVHSDFQAAGVAPTRVQLREAAAEPDGRLRAYADVDIALDTFPYNAAPTTTCEALWMGVPVITLSGDRPCARTSTSLLAQVGLERLDSQTAEEYAETAVELARDLDRLRILRLGMRDRMRVSPLMDERDFARRFEAALRDMWRHWCQADT